MSTSETEPPPSGVGHARLDLPADVLDAGIARERERSLADELHARVGLGVVRGGDHRAAVELARADEEIEHLGADHPRVEDLAPFGDQAVCQATRHLGRLEAHVATQADAQLRGGLLAKVGEDAGEAPADEVRRLAVHVVPVEAPDVVGLEDLRLDRRHPADSSATRPGSAGLRRFP